MVDTKIRSAVQTDDCYIRKIQKRTTTRKRSGEDELY